VVGLVADCKEYGRRFSAGLSLLYQARRQAACQPPDSTSDFVLPSE
jgi:hypothetical protein